MSEDNSYESEYSEESRRNCCMHNKQKEKQNAVDKITAEIEQGLSDVREKKNQKHR